MKTIYRRIRSFGLLSYRPRLVLDIVVKDWTEEWHNMVFTDESRFCLGMHNGRRQVRRRRGERPDIEFAFERPVHRTVGVMVWGAIGYGSRSSLVFIRGSMTSVRYISSGTVFVTLPEWSSLANISAR
jgi:hypothetical protein